MNEHTGNFRKALITLFSFLLIFILLIPQGNVAAQVRSDTVSLQKEVTFEDLGYTSDVEYQGVLVSHEYDVNLPQNWAFTDAAKLQIHFSHSKSLNSSSSMAVQWNGVSVGSTLLSAENADDGLLEIEVPADALVAGYNKITIQFYMGIRDDFCEDFDNPAVWAVVKKASTLLVNYQTTAPEAKLQNLKNLLIDPSYLANGEVTLVLPDSPSMAELNAAALISSKLGQLADWREMAVNVIKLSQLSNKQVTGNVIYIGLAQNIAKLDASLLPQFTGTGSSFKLLDTSKKPVADGAGVLWLQNSMDDTSALWLTVTADDEEGLQKAASAFTNTSLYKRFNGPIGIVISTPEASTELVSPSLNYSLAELGYSDIVASGSREQSTYITFPLQLVFDSEGDAIINLNFSHSKELNEKRSSLNILLNNVPVGSIDLNDSNADDATAAIKIPLRLFTVGTNTLTITSNLQVNSSAQASTLYCTDKYYSDSWLTVSPTTNLEFPSGIGVKTASLAGFPNLSLGAEDFSNLAVIVPEKPDWNVVTSVLQIVNRLGRNSSGDSLNLTIVPASKQAEITTSRPNQILVGLPSDNAAIQAVNDLLPQAFESDFKTPKTNPALGEIAPANGSLGYIESLYTKDGEYRLVLTGTSAQSLVWDSTILDTPTLYKSFTGNLGIVSSENEVAFYTIDSSTSLVSNKPEVSTENKNRFSQYPEWVFWFAAAIFILTIGTILFVRLKRTRK